MTDTVRLARRVAEIAGCSRSEAAQYIEGGWVEVDGRVVEEPGFRVPAQADIVLLPGATPAPVLPVTLLLHKPPGLMTETALQLITPDHRAADDRAGLRFLRRHAVGHTIPMPLAFEASGLLVLTQDWRVLRKLTEDAVRIEQEFIVDVAGDIASNGLALLNHGLHHEGKAVPPMKVSWQNETRLRFAVKAPPQGLIADLCRQVGLTPLAIRRIRLGRIPMASLAVGQWRYLLEHERF